MIDYNNSTYQEVTRKENLNELALFAGAGGGILASHLLGWRTICAVEVEDYPRRVLLARQRDGILPRFPIWDDVCTFDGKPWRGRVDVISGGFPCQDISSAGKGTGLTGARSGLWFEMLRIVNETQPAIVFAENSPLLRKRGLGTIISGLNDLGYDVCWGVLGAWHVGGSHKRERMWILASNPNNKGLERCIKWTTNRLVPLDNMASLQCFPRKLDDLPKPILLGKSHGVANRVDRTKAIGNGQVPAVAATAFRILSTGFLLRNSK